ncbi:uncharacterized protein LOC143877641 [Tasmannia lanceolata]|uniref:uncharacterized protein LOC143877641 n=1 Tax=Tasmannia lanceolata TaxID=3420 RepID=UPI004064C128
MAYSYSEFNEVDFPEYDPTPYGGGFDLVLTYGKPLSPSGKICYPRSNSEPNSSSLDGSSYGSVQPPYGQHPDDHERPQNGGGLTRSYEEERPSDASSGNWPQGPIPVPSHGYDYNGESIFGYGYGNGYGYGYGNGHDRDHDHGHGYGDYNKPVETYNGKEEGYGSGREEQGYGTYGYGLFDPQPAYDYHPDHISPYADPFSNWSCVSQDDGKKYDGHDANEQNYENQWKGTVDYFFGYPHAYGENRDESHSYGNPTYGYERHSNEQAHYVQDEYIEPSWFQKPSYYDD